MGAMGTHFNLLPSSTIDALLGCYLNSNRQQMSSNYIRAGTASGRKAAIREVATTHNQELLPSSIPLPKPTRDVSASNRSQSILNIQTHTHSEQQIKHQQSQDLQLEKQANIIYTNQFKNLSRLLGNESMDFDDLRNKVEFLLKKESNLAVEQELKHRVQALQKELGRREHQRSQSAYIGNLKAMESQLTRKNKIISEFNDSIRKQTFEEVCKELENQVHAKEKSLRSMEEQMQEVRIKSASQIGTLEEQIIKRNQMVQKLTFELDTLKRKYQNTLEESQRAKKRQRQLQAHIESQSKATYQGVSYSINALLKQLESRDNELREVSGQQASLEKQRAELQEQLNEYKKEVVGKEVMVSEFKANLDHSQKMTDRLQQELTLLRQELQMSKQKERELLNQLQSETKTQYQGMTYHISTLLQHLESKDGQIQELQQQQHSLNNEVQKLQQEANYFKSTVDNQQNIINQYKTSINYYEKMAERQKQQLEWLSNQNQQINLKSKQMNQQYEQSGEIKYQGTTYYVGRLLQQIEEKNHELDDMHRKWQQIEEEKRKMSEQVDHYQRELESQQITINQLRIKLQEEITYYQGQLDNKIQAINQLNSHLQVQENQKNYIGELKEQINEYVRKEDQLTRHLEQTGQINYQGSTYNINDLVLQLQVRDNKLNQLEQDRQRQLCYTKKLWQEQEEKLKQALASYQQQLRRNSDALKQHELKIEFYESQKYSHDWTINNLQTEIEQLRTVVVRLEGQLNEEREAKQHLERQEATLLEEKNCLNAQISQLRSTENQYKLQLKQLSEQRNEDRHCISTLEHNIQQQKEKAADTVTNFTIIQNKLLQEIEARTKVQFELSNKDQQVSSKVSQLELRRKSIELKRQRYLQDKEALIEEISVLTINLEGKEDQLANLYEKYQKLKEDYRNLEDENISYRNRNNNIVEELFNYQSQNEEYSSKIAQYSLKMQGVSLYEEKIAQMENKLQNHNTLEQQVFNLKSKLEEYDLQLNQADQLSGKLAQLEQQLEHYQNEEIKLRMLLDEATDKERHLEANVQAQTAELQELRGELEGQRGQNAAEREQINIRLEGINEQLEYEKRRYDEEEQVRGQIEQELAKQREMNHQLEQQNSEHQAELTIQKQKSEELQSRIQQLLASLEAERKQWNDQKYSLIDEKEQAKSKISASQNQYFELLQKARSQHQIEKERLSNRITELQQQKHDLLKLIQELRYNLEKANSEKEHHHTQELRPSLDTELGSLTFNYEGRQNRQERQQESKTEELYHRLEELQNKVDQLQDKQNVGDTYLKAQDQEEHLKMLLNSLQQQKESIQSELERIKNQDLSKLRQENESLQIRQDELKQKMVSIQNVLQQKEQAIEELNSQQNRINQQLVVTRQKLIEKETFINEINNFDNNHEELLIVKQTYEAIQKELQEKNNKLVQQLNNMQIELESIKGGYEVMKNDGIQGRQLKQKEINTLREEVEKYRQREDSIDKKMKQYNTLVEQVEDLQNTMKIIQEQLKQNIKIQKQLQEHNLCLQQQNYELNNRIRQKEEQEHRILSKLSKKSNVSGNEASKREDQCSEGGQSSDGQLTRRILNYDPSKISGQESKFSPNIAFESSKIHVVKEVTEQENIKEIQIKEQRNEQSELSKTVQERQRSATDLKSQKQSPKQSQKEIAEKKAETQSIHRSRNSYANSAPSQKHYSQYSGQSITNHLKKDVQIVVEHPQKINYVNHNEPSTPVDQNTKKQEYLPQQSSKKTISNDSKKLTEEKEKPKYEPFQKRQQSQLDTPVYEARGNRPSIIQKLHQFSPRDSQSRSNSKNKITISYGQSQKSFEIHPGRRAVIYEDKSQTSKSKLSNSHINSMMKGNNQMNEISPVVKKQSELQFSPSPGQSLQTSIMKNPISYQENNIRSSFIKSPQIIKSETLIRRVTNGNAPTHPQNYQRISAALGNASTSNYFKKQSPPAYIPNIQSRSSEGAMQLTFNTVRSGGSPTYERRSNIVNNVPERRSIAPQTQVSPVYRNSGSESLKQTVPVRVSMNRVSSGRRQRNTGDSLTFGARTNKKDKDDMSQSSDSSGIEIMQYDWTTPCCKSES